jgi:hypothetical protein
MGPTWTSQIWPKITGRGEGGLPKEGRPGGGETRDPILALQHAKSSLLLPFLAFIGGPVLPGGSPGENLGLFRDKMGPKVSRNYSKVR